MPKKERDNNKFQERGITLVALVITIIVLLILAGVTLNGIFGESGIINNAEKAKENTEIANEKELIGQASTLVLAQSKTGEITVEEMQKAMNDTAGEKVTKAIDNGDKIAVKFEKSGRYYNLDENGNIEKFTPYFDTTPGILTPNSDDEYMIESIEDLVVFSAIINGEYSGTDIKEEDILKIKKKAVLMCDLDFKSPLSYVDSTTTIYNGYLGVEDEKLPLIDALTNTEEYKGFIPIGDKDNPFNGTFDGKNHHIRNLSENTDTYAGLFGYISSATIQNLTITGKIKSTNYAGGIVGYITDQSGGHKIINCTNYASIYSDTYAGGIIGCRSEARGGAIKLCTNYGDINSSSQSAGGIVGALNGNGASNDELVFSQNCNYGYVYGETYAGGAVGATGAMNGILINCLNGENAIIESNSSSGNAGGILGGTPFRIYNCINLGEIKGYRAGRNYRNTTKLDIYNKKLL